jgi:hypothetical protein
MGTAKVVSLRARPWKVSQLCFEVGGILGQMGATLGSTVTAFNFTSFYAGLSTTAPGDGSLLAFNSSGILGAAPVTASILATLRAEPRAGALDKAVEARQNAFYSRYGNIPAVVTQAQGAYGPSATAKPARLSQLASLAQTQGDLLAAAYTTDGRSADSLGNPVVVKNTNSSLTAKTVTTDASTSTGIDQSASTTTGSQTTTGQSNAESVGGNYFSTATLGALPAGGGSLAGIYVTTTSGNPSAQQNWQEGTSGGNSTQTGASTDSGSSSQTSTGTAYAVETESIVNTDYTYRVPYVESQAQNQRAQISLIDQQFGQFMAGQNLPNLATVLQNELSSIDLGVYQLQIGFLNTILLSPIGGVVTGVYKNPGDFVSPGEPVVRVIDNTTIYLVGSLVYRGPIRVGSTVSVATNLFDAGGTPTTLVGNVVAVSSRGDDDQWDLVVQCTNPLDGTGNPTFPVGYVFDYDNTTATVT